MGVSVSRRCHTPLDPRVLRGAFSRLEPSAVKVARSVLRGGVDREVYSLPDRQSSFEPEISTVHEERPESVATSTERFSQCVASIG